MKKFLIYTGFALIFTLNGMAQEAAESAGTVSNLFLRTGLSARAAGLSESFTAISNDENALFYNPAGLANISKGAVGLTHTQWFEDIRIDNLLVGYTFRRKLGIGFSIAHMWMPSIQGKDYFGQPTGNIDVSSSIISLGLGYKIHRSFFIGLGIKYFQDKLGEFSAGGVAFDAGMYMHTMIRGLTLGAALQNAGGEIKYESESVPIPLTIRIGAAYKIPNSDLQLALDAVKSRDTDYLINGGAEYNLAESFFLRLGNRFTDSEMFTPAFGAGFNQADKYIIDYTYFSREDLGSTHKVGFTFRFNIPGYTAGSSKPYFIPQKINAPTGISYRLTGNKMLIKWSVVPGARYNVYARKGKNEKWVRLNKNPLNESKLEIKKPEILKTYYLTVTSVYDKFESAYSKEAEIHVK
ncbi:MAG: PorV/PorQ family protein [Calditrichaceae bacterium]